MGTLLGSGPKACRHSQGRILHNALEADAVAELLQAHRMSPWRAEPLVYLAWQYARRMQARPWKPSGSPPRLRKSHHPGTPGLAGAICTEMG